MTKELTRLKDLLGPVGRKLRIEDPSAAAAIWSRWPEIVGDDVARNAEPTSLKEGVLRIRTATPTWATEMSYLANDIRARVNDALRREVVREVKIWTSPAPIRGRRGPRHTARDPDAVRQNPRTEDPKTAFERAFAAWSKRRSGSSR